MKNIANGLLILIMSINFSCSYDENDIVPEFLDGTKYGVLLDVDVTSASQTPLSDINSYELTFDVVVKGDSQLVESIIINKIYINNSNEESSMIEQMMLSEFPSEVTLSSAELVNGIPNLSLEDLEIGDSFKINFVINYKDGTVVDRYDSSMRTNFNVFIN